MLQGLTARLQQPEALMLPLELPLESPTLSSDTWMMAEFLENKAQM